MPLEYYANMSAWQTGRGLGAEVEAPVARPLPAMSEKELQKRIRQLPLKSQMQILTEIQYCPAMRNRILQLMASNNPFQAIVIDQMRAIQEVFQPGSSPEHANLWLMLQKYARAALKTGQVTGTLPLKEQLQGLGFTPEAAWATAPHQRLNYHAMLPLSLEGLGDTWTNILKQVGDFWEKDGKKIYDQYGQPLVNKTIEDVAGVKPNSPQGQQATADVNAEMAARMLDLERAAAQKTEEKTEEEPKKSAAWLPILAFAAAGVLALVVVFKKLI